MVYKVLEWFKCKWRYFEYIYVLAAKGDDERWV